MEKEPRTLRDFNFTDCQHPDGSIGYDREPPHCGFCGAVRRGGTFTGGSIDYKIDVVIMRLRGDDLRKNIPKS